MAPQSGGGLRVEYSVSPSLSLLAPPPWACPHLSPGFPIHNGRVMADCCRRVISTPLRMVFRGGSESLYRPAILAAVGRK